MNDHTLHADGTLIGGSASGVSSDESASRVFDGDGALQMYDSAGESAVVGLTKAHECGDEERGTPESPERPDRQQPADAGTPPLTNRGVFRALDDHDRAKGHVDYLKVTVWAAAGEVMDRIRWGFIERWCPDAGQAWTDLGPAKRIAHRWTIGNAVNVLDYADGDFVSVEVKGMACMLLGNEAVKALLWELSHWRIRVSRVDYAWDGVPFDVLTLRDAVLRGDVNSRSIDSKSVTFYENAEGKSVYLGKRTAARFIRCYDRRGPVRFEIEMKQEQAEAAGGALQQLPESEWDQEMLGRVRSCVDLVDRSGNSLVKRCSLLPWWSDFVMGAYKAAALPRQERPESTPVGKLEGAIMRSARTLWAGFCAFGEEYMRNRIEHWSKRRWSAGDDEYVERLKDLAWSGLAGLPSWCDKKAEEVPF